MKLSFFAYTFPLAPMRCILGPSQITGIHVQLSTSSIRWVSLAHYKQRVKATIDMIEALGLATSIEFPYPVDSLEVLVREEQSPKGETIFVPWLVRIGDRSATPPDLEENP